MLPIGINGPKRSDDPWGAYADLFITRPDVHARQKADGGYYLVRQAVTDKQVSAHVCRVYTIGLYALVDGDLCRWAVLDADTSDGLDLLRDKQAHMAAARLPSYLEASRRGGHLWVFFDRLAPAWWVREILGPYGVGIELYPKQDTTQRVGSLVRAPLGVHRLTGKCYPFIDPRGQWVASTAIDQIAWLAAHVQRVPVPGDVPRRRPAQPALPLVTPRCLVRPGVVTIADWLGSVNIVDVVGQYVTLDRRGVGRCPWPEHHKNGDAQPSFQVFQNTQRWWCHTARIGGDAFDFFTRYHGITPREAWRLLCGGAGD